MYQISESNRIEKIDSVARIELNRNFFARIGMLYYVVDGEKSGVDSRDERKHIVEGTICYSYRR